MSHRLAFLLAAIPIAACTSDLEPEVCPSVGVGDLVITEVRGPQSGTYGEWIELWNAGGAAIDLRGLHLDVRELDGDNPELLIVRASTTVAAGDYVVLGAFPDAQRPAHVDYGWHPDGLKDDGSIMHLPVDGGVLAVTACGVTIDRVVWNDLPADGTYALGVMPPDAVGNDVMAAWCTDTIDDDPVAPGLPGTPGVSNHPCP